jgi:hypothetical protein
MLPCVGCAYRESIPGDAHSRCVFDWSQDEDALVTIFKTAHLTRKTQQWFRFPFNYDPVWGPDACPHRAEARDPAKVAPKNPWADMLSLLG